MTAAIQRPLKGSRVTTFYPVKDLPSLASLDSAFQLQEYISLLVRKDPHNVEAITSLPGQAASKEASGDSTKTEEADKSKTEVTVDQWCWVYEQIRRLAQDLTHPLITTLQTECTRASCPEMKAGEWLYLCVAHGNEGSMEQCCAIDYILHTLDSATALLNSPRAFPSRIQIPETSQRHFASLARRLGRIFAHAYFHHREAFEQAEAESSLYSRFLALASKFDLVPAEFLPIPPDAFYASADDGEERHPRNAPPPKLLAAGTLSQLSSEADGEQRQQEQQEQLKSILQDSQEPTSSSLHLEPPRDANSSPNPPGLAPEASPRRAGRNRTDTMVFSDAEAQSFAEQLTSRSGNSPEGSSAAEEAAPPTSTKSFAEATAEKMEDPAPIEVDLVDLTEAAPTNTAEETSDETKVETSNEASPEVPSTEEKPEDAPAAADETEPQSDAPETGSQEKASEEPVSEVLPVDIAASQPESEPAETASTASTAEDAVSDSSVSAPEASTATDEPVEDKPAETSPESSTVEDSGTKDVAAPAASTTIDSEKDASKETTSS
ncbi:mps one binder kinase activator-like 4 [Coprinopsis sp. MPI-PUGE-AT-0042]|nr:mps one binder kinase activator-like 4 [Coprinopsis sp. MPI-PUGE-AT-0042]